MRGIVLAGGTGSRLGPLTKAVNKHLLPIRGVPMIQHAIRVLKDNNIYDITIVSSPDGLGQLAKLLGGGYTYRVQDSPGGIAQALLCADSASTESVAVILGDNMFFPSPAIVLRGDASVVLAEVDDPSAFGVAAMESDRIVGIIEKPAIPPSKYAVTGLYALSYSTLRKLAATPHSGEYELTEFLDVLAYNGCLSSSFVPGFWGDAGTLEGIERCES